ncbi:hypothetical protein O3G_MSEX014422 [Manduca sexta]|uniref:Uncharacterized protein n=1 Tax=Manduca sexta TaxID=7130 RepID=A0A922CY80_MANSE|nr:hypothetical protein O3G_MSEX014422 [Manduca sexta]
MSLLLVNVILGYVFIYSVESAPQQPEINDQYETTELNNVTEDTQVDATRRNAVSITFSAKLYHFLSTPIVKFISAPKVNAVLRNIGTCIVNGAMEIVSYYFPAPFIPLIASAAGMVIPFEPVVLLKEKMPVTSYRRAFKTAVDSFLGTFDKYKSDDDPYMTRRFNRRFNYDSKEKEKD